MYRIKKHKWKNELKKEELQSTPFSDETISPDIFSNEQVLRDSFQNCSDFVVRPITISGKAKILFVYVDGLVDTKTLNLVVLKPLTFSGLPPGAKNNDPMANIIYDQLIAVASVSTISKMSELVESLLKAKVGILVEGETKALIADLSGFETRSIEEPSAEVTIRGPREGFTESLRINTTLLRRRIRSTKLKMESFTIGELSKTDVVVTYIEGVVASSLLKEVRKRISRIKIDGVLDSEFIEEFIEDVPYSPFPQIQNTERPDVVSANILEGKVAIIVDNTPFALIIPMTFWDGLQSAEDYYERYIYSSFIRIIRYILFNTSLFLPSLYVALTTYHPKLIPTALLISIASAREGTPFPAIIEALIMELMFEGLREAGVRLPKPVGSAVSIVGALVIGQAAVQAGIVSAPMVIVVASTGIASFSIPRYNFGTALRIIRFVMLILAGTLGLYGIAIGLIALTVHLINLQSFGVPYFSPVAPQIPSDLKDILVRAPRWDFNYRPAFISGRNKLRIPFGQKSYSKRRGNGK